MKGASMFLLKQEMDGVWEDEGKSTVRLVIWRGILISRNVFWTH